ncbi:hypothetical protein [Anabaena sp. PCC 7108]|uniref:hypothetical protein n=1 Tax=Anabaena sp. PCC 7108 TaxID=163908 RepID=UPI00034CB811|nr:hypothetical protein [Anabaena sp. PCC 7108]
MANIQISTLLPTGYELFNDSASFLDELATQEMQGIAGGGHHSCHYHKQKSHDGSYNNNNFQSLW